MDARPQRPRVLRIHDENQLPASMLPANPVGKSLNHQRHKSSPALSVLLQSNANKAIAATKKILGEANNNIKLSKAVDDSNIGKISPGKLASQVQLPKVQEIGPLARPATRPISTKSMVGLNTAAAYSTNTSINGGSKQTASNLETSNKVVPKKSSRVLKDVAVLPSTSSDGSTIFRPVATRPAVHSAYTRSAADSTKATEVEIAKPVAELLKPQIHSDNNVALPPSALSHQPVRSTSDVYQQPYLPSRKIEHIEEVDEEDYYIEDGYATGRSFGLTNENTSGFTTVLGPVWTDDVLDELAVARDLVELNRTPEDDEDDQWDTSMVAEYSEEIFAYMRELEERMSPNPYYMDRQHEIQWSMRALLMDWVIQVHERFGLLPETLFLTINYIDRFLSCKVVSLGKLQLVGVTAIFIAAKYEEVQCPTLEEIIYMVDGGYSVDELLKAERFMLSMLMFELGWPGPMSFLRRISKADDYDLETRTLAKYFLEVTIMDERFVGSTPSYLAAGSHCLARLMLGKGSWTPAHVHYSGYTYSQMMPMLQGMLECCEEPERHHAAVYQKYAHSRFQKASKFVGDMMKRRFRLPAKQNQHSLTSSTHGVALW